MSKKLQVILFTSRPARESQNPYTFVPYASSIPSHGKGVTFEGTSNIHNFAVSSILTKGEPQ